MAALVRIIAAVKPSRRRIRLCSSCVLLLAVVGCSVRSSSETASEPPAPLVSTSVSPGPPDVPPSSGVALDSESSAQPAHLESPLAPPAEVEDASLAVLVEKFESWATKNKAELGLVVVDVETRTVVASSSPDVPRNPASNQKLFTAAAALVELGPEYRFRTEILGEIGTEGEATELVFRGGGAPDLSTSDVVRLARAVVRLGLAKVERLVVDQSLFETPFVPPAFEQQPDEWASFRAPISALAIDKNTITLEVVPGKEGESARFFYEPPGAVLAVGAGPRTEKGDRDGVSWTLEGAGKATRLTSKLGGALGALAGRRRYARRVDDPRLLPGYALAELLREQGVEVGGDPILGERKAKRLVHWDSSPLRRIVFDLGKDSDNFVAEMLLVALSAKGDGATRAWSSALGARALTKFARRILPEQVAAPLVFKNGSGLFDANRVTPRSLALLLAEMTRHGEVFPEFLAQLAVGGVDGTLSKRFSEARGRIRAKTGTLKDTIALSGYADRHERSGRYAFSVIVVGGPSAMAGARGAIDQFVAALAR